MDPPIGRLQEVLHHFLRGVVSAVERDLCALWRSESIMGIYNGIIDKFVQVFRERELVRASYTNLGK